MKWWGLLVLLVMSGCGEESPDSPVRGAFISMSADLEIAEHVDRDLTPGEYFFAGGALVPTGTSSTVELCDVRLYGRTVKVETATYTPEREGRWSLNASSVIREEPLITESRWRFVIWRTKSAENRPSDWYVGESEVLEFPLEPCAYGPPGMCPQGHQRTDVEIETRGPDCSQRPRRGD